jgi:TP901 family phage tail tape measure protein
MPGPTIAELQVRLNVHGLHYVSTLESALRRVGRKEINRQLDGQARALLGIAKASEKAAKASEKMSQSFRLMGGRGNILNSLSQFSLISMGAVRGFRMLGGAIQSSLEPLIEFQKNMALVRTKGGFNVKQTAEMAEGFKQMSRGSIYSPQQVSAAAVDVAASGLQGPDIMKALPTVLRFAQAGDLQTSEASDILINAMSQLGEKPENLERLGDLMVKTANMSTINVRELAHTMKYAAVPARQLGVSQEQMFAAMGVLGNFGIKGSKAGTGLRNLFSSLARPPRRGKTAAKILGKIGMTQEDLKQGSQDIPTLLAEMQKRMNAKKFSNADRLEMAAVLFGQYGMTSAGALGDASVDKGRNGLESFTKALIESQGEMQKSADIMGGTYANKLQRLQSQWDLLKITITEKMGPALSTMLDRTTAMVQKWEAWAASNPQILADIGKMAEAFAGALPRAIEATIGALRMMQPILTPMVTGLTTVANAWANIVTNQDGQRDVSDADQKFAREKFATERAKAAGMTGTGAYADAKMAAYAEFDAARVKEKEAERQRKLEESRNQVAEAAGKSTEAGNMLSGQTAKVDIQIGLTDDGKLKAMINKLTGGSSGLTLNVGTTNRL